jgi:hypothetical protein
MRLWRWRTKQRRGRRDREEGAATLRASAGSRWRWCEGRVREAGWRGVIIEARILGWAR